MGGVCVLGTSESERIAANLSTSSAGETEREQQGHQQAGKQHLQKCVFDLLDGEFSFTHQDTIIAELKYTSTRYYLLICKKKHRKYSHNG